MTSLHQRRWLHSKPRMVQRCCIVWWRWLQVGVHVLCVRRRNQQRWWWFRRLHERPWWFRGLGPRHVLFIHALQFWLVQQVRRLRSVRIRFYWACFHFSKALLRMRGRVVRWWADLLGELHNVVHIGLNANVAHVHDIDNRGTYDRADTRRRTVSRTTLF